MKFSIWNDILISRCILHASTIWQIGNGELVSSRLYKWCGDSFLFDDFPNLFNIAYDKSIVVAVAFHNSRLNIWVIIIPPNYSFSIFSTN